MSPGNNVRHLASSERAIRTLHVEIEHLASLAAGAYITRTPIRVECHGKDRVEYWHDDNDLKVFAAGGCVHIAGTLRMATWPDWYALSGEEARRIANALLSAAAHVAEAVTE